MNFKSLNRQKGNYRFLNPFVISLSLFYKAKIHGTIIRLFDIVFVFMFFVW